jgi:FkbM family methyltransferase
VEIEGIKFRVYPSLNHHDLMIAKGLHFDRCREDFALMQRHLSEGDTFIDIGANTGSICIPLAVRTGARVIAVEPNPFCAGLLRYNASLNGLKEFTIVPCAVGPSGTVRLWKRAGNLGEASLHKLRRLKDFVDAESKPLLQIVRDAGTSRIALLKIDIEGAEDQALCPFFADAPGTLWPRAVYIEHAHKKFWKADCIAMMQEIGYRIDGEFHADTMLVLDKPQ